MAEESKSSEKYEKQAGMTSETKATSPMGMGGGLRKCASTKRHNCLCSPTTHAGSFRCRYHRNSGLSRSGMSVGSKLSELAGKSTAMCDNIHLVAAHRHSSSSSSYLPA